MVWAYYRRRVAENIEPEGLVHFEHGRVDVGDGADEAACPF